jgi:hypothetical protein
MVSPVFKGGVSAGGPIAVSPDGESVHFSSSGIFEGNPEAWIPQSPGYLSRRTSAGWSTVPLGVPQTVGPLVEVSDLSATLDSVLAIVKPGANRGNAVYEGVESDVLLHLTAEPDTPAAWSVVGEPLKALDEEPLVLSGYEGASADFCHVFFNGPGLLPLAAKKGVSGQLYELTRGCGEEPPSLRLAALDNAEPEQALLDPGCLSTVGGAKRGQEVFESDFNAIAAGGRVLFFSPEPNGAVCTKTSHQLFVRLNGAKTLEISRPLAPTCSEVPCAGSASRARAEFAGASEDGSRVYFTTAASLLGEPPHTSEDLYMATIGCQPSEPECPLSMNQVLSLSKLSVVPNEASPSEFQGVIRVAPDGSRVYFVARGALTDAANSQHRSAVKGADNLYVYDTHADSVTFVTELCSGPAASGAVADSSCPSNVEASLQVHNDDALWASASPDAQTAGADGRFLVFSSFGQLTPDDTDTARDVYRYDALTGSLLRVSAGESGYDANGNDASCNPATLCDATITSSAASSPDVVDNYGLKVRAASADGSRIVFFSGAPLSPNDRNGLINAYEWHQKSGESEGEVSLVSTGSDKEPVIEAVMSASGRDLVFRTPQSLVPQDTDGLPDVYDARLGGGFPAPPAPRQPCLSEACQGPLSSPTPLSIPGSVSQAPGGNFAAPPSKPTPSVKKATPKCPKGKKLSNGKCVKTKKAKAKKANKSGHRRGR